MRIALTGATGHVGGALLPLLLERGHDVACLARRPGRLAGSGADVVEGDAVTGAGVERLLDGAQAALYLIHSMGGTGGSFAEQDLRAAANFGAAARAAGVEKVVYLGGLPARGAASEHLRSREETAAALAEAAGSGVRVVHARAAMVIGAGSASFEMLSCLVRRLPAMVCPRWIDTRTQPIAIEDVTAALAALAESDDPPAEAQLGGRDVVSYREMMERFARLDGRRPPLVVRVPMLTPRLSSYWVALVTPVSARLALPLVAGLGAEMTVEVAPPAGINDDPLGFDDAVRRALAGT